MMIALGKVPTMLGTVINITISGGWVKKSEADFTQRRKGADGKALRSSGFAIASLRPALCAFA